MPVILTTPEMVETWMTAPDDRSSRKAFAARRGAADRCRGGLVPRRKSGRIDAQGTDEQRGSRER